MAKPEVRVDLSLATDPDALREHRRALEEAIGREFQVKVGIGAFIVEGAAPIAMFIVSGFAGGLLGAMGTDAWGKLRSWFSRLMQSEQRRSPGSEHSILFLIRESGVEGSEFEITCAVKTDSPDVVIKAMQTLGSAKSEAEEFKAQVVQAPPGQRLRQVSMEFDIETDSWALLPGAVTWTRVRDEPSE